MHLMTIRKAGSAQIAWIDAGGFDLVCFLDGLSPRQNPHELFGLNVDAKTFEAAAVALPPAVTDPSSQYSPCLIRDQNGLTLFDAGRGWPDGPSGKNNLLLGLTAAGIEPGDIDRVALTHGHPDHVGGLIDPGGQSVFPRAEVLIPRAEYDHWTGTAPVTKKREASRDRFRGVVGQISGQIRLIDTDEEIGPGIKAVSTPGHSAGHHSFLMTSGRAPLLIVGDVFTHPYYSFRHVDWHVAIDDAPEQAAATRGPLLARCADDSLWVHAYHLPFVPVGRVAREGLGFRWDPIAQDGTSGGAAKT